MKSYTDLEQSNKLVKILPKKSADMWWNFYSVTTDNTTPQIIHLDTPWVGNFNWNNEPDNIPSWSLAALIDVLPNDWWGYNKHYFLEISKMGDNAKPYEVRYYRFREQSDGANFGRITHISCSADNPIDACYEMILKLNELNLL